MSDDQNLDLLIYQREIGHRKHIHPLSHFFSRTNKYKDDKFKVMADLVSTLATAMKKAGNWQEVEYAVAAILTQILDSTNAEQMFAVTPSRSQEREYFIKIGGVDLLLKLFEKPWSDADARMTNSNHFSRKSELWNEVLVILREVAYAVPTSSSLFAGTNHIVYLFTMLSQTCVFENSLTLLEEILSARVDTFDLSLVPDFYSLVSKFSPRQLAYFCRVLSLALFESEDRQLMEGSYVLRALELVQLRRDRMARINCVVERNQILIVEMPDLITKIVQILTIVNYGPGLTALLRYNIMSHSLVPIDLLHLVTGTVGSSEWATLSELHETVTVLPVSETAVDNNKAGAKVSSSNSSSSSSASSSSSSGISLQSIPAFDSEDQSLCEEILSLFSNRQMDMSTFNGVVRLAQMLGMGLGSSRTRNGKVTRTPKEAKKQLIFHSILLTPHVVEVLFVLCTLLSGRRKIEVQNMLLKRDFSSILRCMFDRMSWEDPPFSGRNPLEHIHGPGCDCNPESAIRVQLLRLLHNYYDRDFVGNTIKTSLLSEFEKTEIAMDMSIDEFPPLVLTGNDIGILSRIMFVLKREPADSIYRFWLSSCLEAFLRGTGPKEQLFIGRGGILEHTAKVVIEAGAKTNNVLQTAFDLLGEIIKANKYTLRILADSFDDNTFEEFINVVMGNLIDSNVFIRSLYLSEKSIRSLCKDFNDEEADCCVNSFDSIGGSNAQTSVAAPTAYHSEHGFLFLTHDDSTDDACNGESKRNVSQAAAIGAITAPGLGVDAGYISHSWVQFAPPMLVTPRTSANIGKPKRSVSDQSDSRKVPSKARDRIPVHHSSSAASSAPQNQYSLSSMLGTIQSMASSLLANASALNQSMSSDSDDASDCSDDGNELPSSLNEMSLSQLSELLGIDAIDVDGTGIDSMHVSQGGQTSNTALTSEPMFSASRDQITNGNNRIDKRSIVSKAVGAASSEGTRPGKAEPVAIIDSRRHIRRFLDFLTNSKVKIVYRLLSSLSIRTVNHENICCVNTAILICLMSYASGKLESLLESVRRFADREDLIGPTISDGSGSATEVDSFERSPPPFVARYGEKGSLTASQYLMVNFRELLWYWREYYLRRGRDRLSLEFSSHIPFSKWIELIGKLCADDGSALSLLPSPIPFPRSPYAFESRAKDGSLFCSN